MSPWWRRQDPAQRQTQSFENPEALTSARARAGQEQGAEAELKRKWVYIRQARIQAVGEQISSILDFAEQNSWPGVRECKVNRFDLDPDPVPAACWPLYGAPNRGTDYHPDPPADYCLMTDGQIGCGVYASDDLIITSLSGYTQKVFDGRWDGRQFESPMARSVRGVAAAIGAPVVEELDLRLPRFNPKNTFEFEQWLLQNPQQP